MKKAGVILMIIGVLILVFRFSYTKQKKEVDIGPVEVKKMEHNEFDWAMWGAVGLVVIGSVVFIAGRNNTRRPNV